MSDLPTAAVVAAGTTVALTAGKSALKAGGSFIGLLLNPSATVIGKEWGNSVKEWFEERRRNQQVENLKHHVEAAQKMAAKRPQKTRKRKLTKSPPEQSTETPQPSVSTLNGVEKWSEAARDVGPEEETALIWQAILADLLNNQDVDEIVIETLRLMKSVELRELLMIEKKPFQILSGDRDSLCEKWLLEKDLVSRVISPRLSRFGGSIFALLSITIIANYFLPGTLGGSSAISNMYALVAQTSLWASTLLLSGTFFIFWMRNNCTVYVLKPTWLGYEIIARAQEVGFGKDDI